MTIAIRVDGQILVTHGGVVCKKVLDELERGTI